MEFLLFACDMRRGAVDEDVGAAETGVVPASALRTVARIVTVLSVVRATQTGHSCKTPASQRRPDRP